MQKFDAVAFIRLARRLKPGQPLTNKQVAAITQAAGELWRLTEAATRQNEARRANAALGGRPIQKHDARAAQLREAKRRERARRRLKAAQKGE